MAWGSGQIGKAKKEGIDLLLGFFFFVKRTLQRMGNS